ncbi:iron-containing alcohol dehydrogenase [Gordonia sp. ABSL11-1]|uniref:iron-containing alcohol dehydrogenase n=1 Tax=Gordonia sp. ABSL11-1 TaxID=3053924 RepID=UPI002572B08A|nr:iron-containing alcohol dehydrogenase [Gordonia sp. ABSL11-1]MDL9947222.1 iron-containing alcohol dehydrogenase [Gordonia sp. ABSL11-1]
MTFDLHIPTRIVFGAGTVNRTGELTGESGSHALVVTGRRAARAHGHLQRVLDSLQVSGIHSTVYDEVSPNPRSDEIDAAAAITKARDIDVVIGLGGGSAIDAAKAIAVTHSYDSTVRDLIGHTLDTTTSALPIIAVPTTAGSGSEVTKGAIITDTTRNFRAGIRGAAVTPRTAIIDSDLLATVPPTVLADTAFDSLAHAIEGAVARRSTPVSRTISTHAISLITENLPPVLEGNRDPKHLDALALASVLGGINVATVSTCLPHRLQQALGALPQLNISHGRGLAALYPAWLEHTEPSAMHFSAIAHVLDNDTVYEGIKKFTKQTGTATRLRDWGIDHCDLPTVVNAVTGNLDNDPAIDIDATYIHSIYARSL